MTIYLLMREEQSAHGFVDMDVVAAFRDRPAADARLRDEVEQARAGRVLVEGEEGVADGEGRLRSM